MADEGSQEYHPSSLAAPLIFMIVVAFQFVTKYLKILKKATKSEKEIQLHGEIKKLLKEASSLSQPSTFAQAAKLRRQAAAKEKELSNYHDLQGKEIKMSYDLYLKAIFISKLCHVGFHICSAAFMVLEGSCGYYISATCSTFWEITILAVWRGSKRHRYGRDNTLVNGIYQG